MINRPNPQKIPNNFRYQPYIDEELAKAKTLLAQKNDKSSAELADIALTFLETGDWQSVTDLSSEALKLEDAKTEGTRDKEVIAAVHYMSATKKRELNDCDGALLEYEQAYSLAQSLWLKTNILRNIGLAYLKKQDFSSAAKYFKEAYDLANDNAHMELRGSLPALYNYYGLALTRAALTSNQDPALGLKIFEDTTQLYKVIFNQKSFTETQQRQCHDWQSHQFHRGMILSEMAEKQCKDKDSNENRADAQVKFRKAEELFLGSLAGRIENKADDQRLGDVYVWLGRAAVGLNQTEKAGQYLEKALTHYIKAFPKKSDAPEANQIKDVRGRLEKLSQPELKSPSSFGQSIFSTTSLTTATPARAGSLAAQFSAQSVSTSSTAVTTPSNNDKQPQRTASQSPTRR